MGPVGSGLEEDVFLASHLSSSPTVVGPASHTGRFPQRTPRTVPTEASTGQYSTWKLPSIPLRRATVEEVPDEDDISVLARRYSTGPVLTSDDESDDEPAAPTPPLPSDAPLPPTSSTPPTHPIYEDDILLDGKLREAPAVSAALLAAADLRALLRPRRPNGIGYIDDPELDPFVRVRMEAMQSMLHLYTNDKSKTFGQWRESSIQASITQNKGPYWARQTRILVRQFIRDRTILPLNPYGYWKTSMLVDEELKYEIDLHLQELGKEITAQKLVEFLGREDVMVRHGISKKISLRTAQRYLGVLGYRWTYAKKGQYADGHERPDVVNYREKVFLPSIRAFYWRMEFFSRESTREEGHLGPGKPVVLWFHDESIFYAHDRKKKSWFHKDAPAQPYKKGALRKHNPLRC
ncbi:hypothetical protein C8R46DRAFT_879250 [Mycena filopes]|nr:hypothetical protein C8R46DRAFT_879250 [Mycena filopes]